MKKLYTMPEASVLNVEQEDILTLSVGNGEVKVTTIKWSDIYSTEA